MYLWRSLPQSQLSAVLTWLLGRRPAAREAGKGASAGRCETAAAREKKNPSEQSLPRSAD